MTASPLAADHPLHRHHARRYRATKTEIQRTTAGGGWLTIAVAEDVEWADTIARCLNFFDAQPAFSDSPDDAIDDEDCWDNYPVYGGGTPAR